MRDAKDQSAPSGRPPGRDDRLFSSSASRNRDSIRRVWLDRMPDQGTILEIGSGSGEHGIFIAGAIPELKWLPGDPDKRARASIASWIRHTEISNVAAPHAIDVTSPGWAKEVSEPIVGVVSMNVIHIAPFAVTEGLLRGAAELLAPGGSLFFYGPFSRLGDHTASSNAQFDEYLRAQNPSWGVRDLENEVLPLAAQVSFSLEQVVPMPANNFVVILRKS